MINHVRSAIRTIRKQKTYALINISGLTVGLCACLIVATVVIDDLSYDKHWKRADNIYRIITINTIGDGLYERMASSWAGLAPELQKSYPEVESFAPFADGAFRLKVKSADDDGIKVNSIITDSAIWEILDLKIIAGNPKKFIAGQSNLVISESFRNLYFEGLDPIGKIIYDIPAYGDKSKPHLITGVISDIPGNTHLRADVIRIDKRYVETLNKKQWGTFSRNYILLKPGTDINQFTKKVNQWYKGFVEVPKPYQYEFQPIKNVYLDSAFANYQKVKGNRQHIYIFSGVALLLLLIACVNFVNLSTARSVTRLRETGVRKVLGASKRQIMMQFLAEALVIFSVSAMLAIFLYQLSLGYIEAYLEHQLVQTLISKFTLLAAALGMILIVGVLTGLYPAWLMSGSKTAGSLKGNVFSNKVNGQQLLRKTLVVLQFSISIVVLLAMIIVQLQLRYMNNSDLGFDKNNLMSIGFVSWEGKSAAFRNEVAKLRGVRQASISSWIPSAGAGYMSREIDDQDHPGNKINVWYISGDVHLAKTIGLRLKSGRLLSPEFATDAMNEDSLRENDEHSYNKLSEIRPALITATTARMLHVEKLDNKLPEVKTVPVGIVDDFHNESFHEKLGPTIIFAESNPQHGGMLVKIDPGNDQQVMKSVKDLWKEFYPNKLLEINWVDDLLARQYEPENKLKQLFTFFSLLTMILASLGIFGLVVHAAQHRVKEIGVRKVLGASVSSIFSLLSSEFVKLMMIALIIGSPIAWYLMNNWLANFSYRISIPWWTFAMAGLITVITALITISFQSIKAAFANPVTSLRNE
ncbi:ABC transporter permease [Flavitalea sp.]|nr:FtsX-like permease family protein [Flavitalea sp.]